MSAAAALVVAGLLGVWSGSAGHGLPAVSPEKLNPVAYADRPSPRAPPAPQAGWSGATTRWIPSRTTYTLDPYNNSLVSGAYAPPSSDNPYGAIAIPPLGEFVGGGGGGIYVFSATTGAEMREIPVGNTPEAFAYDSAAGILYCALTGGQDDAVAFVNLTTERVVQTIQGIDNVAGLAYDPSNNRLYVSNWTGVQSLNGTSGATVAYLPIHWGVQPMVIDPLTDSLLVADSGNNTIYVVNLTTFRLVSQFLTGANGAGYNPHALLYDPFSQQIYSADYGNASVSILDARTYQLNASVPELNVGGYPSSLALNPLRHEVYVSNCAAFGSRTCVFYDTNDSLANYTLPGSNPTSVAYDNSTNHLLIYNDNDTIYLFNGSNDQELAYVPLITSYLGGALDPTNGLEYIATPALGGICSSPGTISVLDPGPIPSLLRSLPAGDGPSEVAYDSADQRIFVTNDCGNSVTVLDAANDSEVRENLPVGQEPYGVAYDPANDTVWIANENSQILTVLNGSTLRTVATVSLPQGYPYDLAFDPANGSMFVSDIYGRSLTVVNATDYTILRASLPVGVNPQGMLYDAQNGLLYVANGGSNNLSLVNATTLTPAGSIATVAGTSALALDPTDHLLFATDTGGSRIVVVDLLNDTAESPTLPASGNPEGVVYDPQTRQVDVPNFGTGAINILADLPDLSRPTANPSISEVGRPTVLSVGVSNGTPPYSLAYRGLPPGCESANVSSLDCTPTASGTFGVEVEVTDSLGYAATAALNLTVLPPLGAGSLSAEPDPSDVGTSVTFAWNVSGGLSPLGYAYSGLPPGCVSENVSTFSCTPTASGSYVVEGTASDRLGGSQTAWTALRVDPLPEILSFTASPLPIHVNETFVLAAEVGGGTGPDTYRYSGLPPGCLTASAAVIACRPAAPGNFTVTVNTTDSLGAFASANLSVEVLAAAPSPLELLAFLADPANVSVGEPMTLYAVVTGGAPPYRVAFLDLPTGCQDGTGNATSMECRPTLAGEYHPQVVVTDRQGQQAQGSTNVSIAPNGSGGTGGTLGALSFADWILAIGLATLAGFLAGLGGSRLRGRGRTRRIFGSLSSPIRGSASGRTIRS